MSSFTDRAMSAEVSPELFAASLEAIGELRENEIIKNALGVIADEFTELKTREWETYEEQVTQWEVDEYLTFF